MTSLSYSHKQRASLRGNSIRNKLHKKKLLYQTICSKKKNDPSRLEGRLLYRTPRNSQGHRSSGALQKDLRRPPPSFADVQPLKTSTEGEREKLIWRMRGRERKKEEREGCAIESRFRYCCSLLEKNTDEP